MNFRQSKVPLKSKRSVQTLLACPPDSGFTLSESYEEISRQ